MEKRNLRKKNNGEIKKYQIKISNRFAALENFDVDDDDVNLRRVWESTGENIRTSATDDLMTSAQNY
jgi:hypothetical protein